MLIGICDDDERVCNSLMSLLKEHTRGGNAHRIKAFFTADALWFSYEDYRFDLLILDIEMPGDMNGLQVAGKIRARGDDIPIVMLTNHERYAVQSYDVHPFHYLLKPVNREKLFETVSRIEEQREIKSREIITLKTKDGLLRIPFDSILYFESRGHLLCIHTRERIITKYMSMTDIQRLCDERFIQPHRSYLVNADKIERISDGYAVLHMINGAKLPISQKKKEECIRSLMDYTISADTMI